jgi:hypothetical protein
MSGADNETATTGPTSTIGRFARTNRGCLLQVIALGLACNPVGYCRWTAQIKSSIRGMPSMLA